MQLSASQTDRDALISTYITQASVAIMRYAGREFAPQTAAGVERTFRYNGRGWLALSPYDATTITAVEIDSEDDAPTALTVWDDYTLHPIGAPDGVYTHVEFNGFAAPAFSSSSLTRPWRLVSITGTWGFAAVPTDVKLAANILTGWLLRNHSSVPGQSLQDDGDRFGPVGFPTSVKQLLDPWRVVSFGDNA